MKPVVNQSKTAKAEPGAGPGSEPEDDFQTLPLPELQTKLGASPEGLSQAEAQKR